MLYCTEVSPLGGKELCLERFLATVQTFQIVTSQYVNAATYNLQVRLHQKRNLFFYVIFNLIKTVQAGHKFLYPSLSLSQIQHGTDMTIQV